MGELEEKIKKELLKSGFPLQIFCKRCLLGNKWGMTGSEHMIFDDESRKEIDTTGYFQEDLGKSTTVFYTLYIECKKNHNNPWIFFKEDLPYQHILIECENVKFEKSELDVINSIKELHFHKTPLSSIYTMAFQSKSNQIYEAISGLLSSYEFFAKFRAKYRIRRKSGFSSIHVCFFTILFDGKLYLADVKEDDTLELIEENHVIYYHREVKYPRFRHYNIEVVSKDYFPDYLNILNKDRELISNFYRGKIAVTGD